MFVKVLESRVPLTDQWMYRVFINGKLKDLITSQDKWTFNMVQDVTGYYTESLNGYVFGGEYLEGWTPPTNPRPKRPVFENRRRNIRAVED